MRIIIDGRLDMPWIVLLPELAMNSELWYLQRNADQEKANSLRECGFRLLSWGQSGSSEYRRSPGYPGEMEIMSLLLEGGAEINSYMIEKQLVDKLYWFIAPKIIGGRSSPSPLGGKV